MILDVKKPDVFTRQRQDFTFQPAIKALQVRMTVKNLTGTKIGAGIRRHADFDVDSPDALQLGETEDALVVPDHL
mgnify:CR=1 FL=1